MYNGYTERELKNGIHLYDMRGELLDCKADAEREGRPFRMQASLDEVDEQIRVYESIRNAHPVDEAQEIERSIDDELGTHVIISGGDVLELARHFNTDSDAIPF